MHSFIKTYTVTHSVRHPRRPMDLLAFSFHIDQTLQELINIYGYNWTLIAISVVIFLESSCILTPLLPGDSLLFSAGMLSGMGFIPIIPLLACVWISTVIGYALNYTLASHLGNYWLNKPNRWSKRAKKRLSTAREFHDKHGLFGLTLARFVPIVRTFLPFLIGLMNVPKTSFWKLNTLGASLWVFTLILGAYFCGNIPWVQHHFSLIISLIIVLSVLPYLLISIKYVFNLRN